MGDVIAYEVEAAYRRYITDYPAALWRYLATGAAIDYGALDFWAFPLLFITGGSTGTNVAIVDLAEFDDQVRTLYRQYFAGGWGGGIVLDRAEVTTISPAIALIETAGTRYCADGSVLNRWDACYWMRRTERGWRHFAVTDTAAPRPGLADWVAWLSAVAGIITC